MAAERRRRRPANLLLMAMAAGASSRPQLATTMEVDSGGGVVQSTLRDRAVFGGVVPSTHALRASSTVHWYIVNYLTHRKRDEKHLNKVVFLKP
jgi:hypothetical protein